MGSRVFQNRREAGRVLVDLLEHYRDDPAAVVLALPRGGVPVGYEVAAALHLPLDVFVVRKLGAPRSPELAMGAIASGGALATNDSVVRALGVTPEEFEEAAEQEGRELARRERAYRGDRPPLSLSDKTVIVVDDGLATGATMNATLEAIHSAGADRVVVAVPAAPSEACEGLKRKADEVICATTPSPFTAVGTAYWEFDQTTDDEVRELLGTP